LDLNSLNQTLDLITFLPKAPGNLTAAEKYIIKSRLGVVYWRADELPSFICSKHRLDLVYNTDTTNCTVCDKKKVNTPGSGIITYRIGLEYYMTRGKFLGIGLLVCSTCRVKTLKGLDFTGSLCLSMKSDGSDKFKEEESKKVCLPLPNSRHSLANITTHKGNLATIQPVLQKQANKVEVPRQSASEGTIFAKIGKLNDSLQAVNPRYKPLGFSITNLQSLSPGVLQDTLAATQIALQTILSSIAPGQEQQLWEAVKPCMDAAASLTASSNNM